MAELTARIVWKTRAILRASALARGARELQSPLVSRPPQLAPLELPAVGWRRDTGVTGIAHMADALAQMERSSTGSFFDYKHYRAQRGFGWLERGINGVLLTAHWFIMHSARHPPHYL
jgi:hypothetical protein